MDDDTTTAATGRYMTVRQVAEAYPAFSAAALRNLLFFRTENGLDAAVIRVGRRVLIDDLAWRRWLEGRREATRVRPTPAPTTGRRTRGTAAA